MPLLSMFSKDDFEILLWFYPSMSLFAIMAYPSMTQSCSTFTIKCSWQIVHMLSNFAEVVIVYPCMLLERSCHG